MTSVTIYVYTDEMEKAVKGQEFVGYPTSSLGTTMQSFKMKIDFKHIIGTKYSSGSGHPIAVVCQIKRQEKVTLTPPPSSPPPQTGMGW